MGYRFFAPVMTQGLFDVRVRANEEILKTLEKAKLIGRDPEDGEYYIRKKGAWKKKVHKIIRENKWSIELAIEDYKVTWYIRNEEERLEEFLRELDEFIEKIKPLLEEDIEVEV